MCDLYLGADNSRATTPPNPFWTNPSIQSSTYTLTRGSTYPLAVKLQNADAAITGQCMAAEVDLYWSDPTTSFLILASNQIAQTSAVPTQMIGRHTTTMGDGAATFNYSWTPDSAVSGTNSGHVCLAAIGYCTTTDCIAPPPTLPGQTAATGSAQVAIHNVQVNEPPPGPGRRGIWPFFFGAANGADIAGKTRLLARAYDPGREEHRDRLWRLIALPGVRAALGRCAKFAVPAEIHLALGVESVVIPVDVPAGGTPPRLGFTGAVTPELGEHLVKNDWHKVAGIQAAAKEATLLPRQVQQAAVSIEPHGDEGHVYAIEVSHELLTGAGPPVLLGGLTVIFVPSCRPW